MLVGTLPKSIDIGRLESGVARFEGTVSLTAMHRLRALVISPDGVIEASLEVILDKEQYVTVVGAARTRVQLECQRCLEPVEIRLRAPFRLVAVGTLAETETLAGDHEPLLAPGGVIDVVTALEDELLLALPAVAMHERDEPCNELGARDAAQEAVARNTRTRNPFAMLEQLKKRDD